MDYRICKFEVVEDGNVVATAEQGYDHDTETCTPSCHADGTITFKVEKIPGIDWPNMAEYLERKIEKNK